MERVDRPNTLVLTVPEELSSLSRNAIVDKLVAGLNVDEICCIQFVPGYHVRITFSSFDARNKAFLSGIFADSTRLHVEEADPVIKEVTLEHLPVEVPDDTVIEAFRPFGTVHEVSHLKYAGTSIGNGTRLLKMSLASHVPVNFRILRYPCRVFYKGQPRPCSICRLSDHRSVDCPLRDVCRRCREPGHFARDCSKDLNAPAVASDTPAPPVDVDVDDDDDDGDDDGDDDDAGDGDDVDDDDDDDYTNDEDIEEDDDEDLSGDDDVLDSGDEEVLSSVPVPSASLPCDDAPAPSTVSSSVPCPTPMDTSFPYYCDSPRWIKRAPGWLLNWLHDRPHTSDTHTSIEEYESGSFRVAFDFGRLTYKVLKDDRFFEEDRYFAYLTGAVAHPVVSSFAAAATDLPRLSADVAPAPFPVSN